jgi:hypothetical protein
VSPSLCSAAPQLIQTASDLVTIEKTGATMN